MGLIKLGRCVTESNLRNRDGKLGADSVVGLSTQKKAIRTKADLSGVDLTDYKVVPPGFFAYVPDTSRRGDMMSMAYNDTAEHWLVSAISVVFFVHTPSVLLPRYLYMYFNRPEFNRYVRFHSWGSAREVFSWEDMCQITLDLPPLSVQRKYAGIYDGMAENQQIYELSLDGLRAAYEGLFDSVKRKTPGRRLEAYISQSDQRNEQGLDISRVRGLSIEKKIIATKADMTGVELSAYKLLPPGCFAYVTVTSRNGGKITIALNDSEETYLVSSSYVVFSVDADCLLPEYLMMFFNRGEFDRYSRFHSWGSARETFDWSAMCEVELPVPDIKVQRALVDIYSCYTQRRRIAAEMRRKIEAICPVLLRGSLQDGA